MPTFLKHTLPALLLAFAATSASANVVQLGTVSKTYGSAGGSVASTGSGSCDTLNANSITVRDTSSGCGRFNDKFDFSALNYSSIDHLTLTLNFSGTNNFYLGIFPEDWKVRAADSVSHGSSTLLDMSNVSGSTAQSFTIDASQADVFSNISHNGVFYLWFADQGFGPNNFNLSSASLAVHGTAVPEPGSLALLALALAGVGFMRRRRD